MATDVSIFLLFIILYDFSLNPQTDWSIIQSLIKTNWRRNAAHKSFEWDEMSKLIGHWSGRPVETFGAALLDDWDICFVFQCSIAWKSEQSFRRVSLNIFIKCPVGRIQRANRGIINIYWFVVSQYWWKYFSTLSSTLCYFQSFSQANFSIRKAKEERQMTNKENKVHIAAMFATSVKTMYKLEKEVLYFRQKDTFSVDWCNISPCSFHFH